MTIQKSHIKNHILATLSMALLAIPVDAAVYMRVHTNDGKIDKYNVENVVEVEYDEDIFTDITESAAQGVTVSGKKGGFTYVDLGLPSKIMWATYNIGASEPSEYGDYFAWGETKPKNGEYSYRTYKWCSVPRDLEGTDEYTKFPFTKYYIRYEEYDSYDGTILYEELSDHKAQLDPEDDAAVVNWGNGWHIPTKNDLIELVDGCTWKWTENFNGSGFNGNVGTSIKNGNTIFLPAAGCIFTFDTQIYAVGSQSTYSSSQLLGITHPDLTVQAHVLHTNNFYEGGNISAVDAGKHGQCSSGRTCGMSIRPCIEVDTTKSIAYILVKTTDNKVTKYTTGNVKKVDYEIEDNEPNSGQ